MSKLLFTSNEWTFDSIKRATEAISEIACSELKLDPYTPHIEIISSDQMLDAYSSNGLPVMYNHWSFGKNYLRQAHSYRKGLQGLAYEIVINSDPCISYLMEDNSMTMQTLVIAHAAFGHSHFFKNNHMFRQWTDAEGILDYLVFARNYINNCEQKYGAKAVEEVIDACHALMDYGVDRYKRPGKLSKQKEQLAQQQREKDVQTQANDLWRTLPKKKHLDIDLSEGQSFPAEPQENILYFIEKHSPSLQSWEREIVRIVRKMAQYFYPQRQTKVMNEGWASFCHYFIMNRLWEKGQISDGSYMEFAHSHSGVLTQFPFNHKYYSGFNPYALGFDIYTDIKRICENPTKEDEEYFPHLVGQNWLDTCLNAVVDYRDESFIAQFLSPTVMRKWGLFEITNNEDDSHVTISSIQNEKGYNAVRQTLSQQYSLSNMQPNIQVTDANFRGDRSLTLQFTSSNNRRLDTRVGPVLDQVRRLWGYDVKLLGWETK